MDMAAEVVSFWREAGDKDLWFEKSAAFDEEFRARFLDLHMAVAARQHDAWLDSAKGALALLVLTDQFPRNAFRGTAHMYATDPLARSYARKAQAGGHMERVDAPFRPFFCLPFMHSEDRRDQDVSLALARTLGPPTLEFAEGHRDIIRRFGRFPHRNPLLGRETTAEEKAFLEDGGFGG